MKYEWQPPKFGERQEGEAECYGFAVKGFKPFARGTIDFIKEMQEMDGFVGVYPMYPFFSLIYDTKNHAKAARNLTKFRAKVGEVSVCYVPEEYVNGRGSKGE